MTCDTSPQKERPELDGNVAVTIALILNDLGETYSAPTPEAALVFDRMLNEHGLLLLRQLAPATFTPPEPFSLAEMMQEVGEQVPC